MLVSSKILYVSWSFIVGLILVYNVTTTCITLDEIYNAGIYYHEVGLFDQSIELLRLTGDRGRSRSLIELHALRSMDWHTAYDYKTETAKLWWYDADITGKKIFIKHDGGVGDAVQFLRYAKHLHDAGAIVIIETPLALKEIYQRCPYISRCVPYGTTPSDADITITVSTPSLTYTMRETFATKSADVLYLDADPTLCAEWYTRLASLPGPKIGLCWCSSPLYNLKTREKSPSPRSIPLALFEPIIMNIPCTFISLQCGYGAEQLEISHLPLISFPDIDTMHGRFMDTIAIMKNLDLVITVDTSIAHIAGVLGIPVWTILPACSDFRWFIDRTDSPWYPTMQLFRQKPHENWHPVLDTLFIALKERYHVYS